MASAERSNQEPENIFEKFINESVEGIDSLASQPAEKPQLEESPWKQLDKSDILFFAGSLYVLGLEFYKMESILDLGETPIENIRKKKMLEKAIKDLNPRIRHFTPTGMSMLVRPIIFITTDNLRSETAERIRSGMVLLRHPSLSKDQFPVIVNRVIETANKDLVDINENPMPIFDAGNYKQKAS